ncbi:MAG TPA: DUF2800 domain-containing protein [Anaeromyxobacteraceae bacterium]|nr:DUF2800 domain-containing protein [Anaeromyxobacteraceae bacterium]
MNSPSVGFRRRLCAGSGWAEAGKPDTGGHDAARGRIRHAWAAHLLMPSVHAEPAEPLSEDERQDVEAYVALVWKHYCFHASAGAILVVEQRVDLAEIGIPHGGTIDAAIVVPGVCAYGYDYKSGRSYVEAPKHNDQCKAYAWGLAHHFGVPVVSFSIVQGAAHDFVREMVWNAAQLAVIEKEWKAITAAALDPNAPRTPGERQCHDCRAKATCPERNAAITGATQFAKLHNADAVRAMTPAERGMWYALVQQGRARLEEIAKLMEETIVAESLPIDGFRVGPGKRGHRKWVDEIAALSVGRRIAIEKGRDPSALVTERVGSPSDFDKVLGTGADVKHRLSPLIEQPEGKMTLIQNTRPPKGA